MKGKPGPKKILADTWFVAYLTEIFRFKRQSADVVIIFIALLSSLASAALAGAIIATPALIGLTSSSQGLAWDWFIKFRKLLQCTR